MSAVLSQEHYVPGDDGAAAQEQVCLSIRAPAGIVGQAEGIAAHGLPAVVGKGQSLAALQGGVIAEGGEILRSRRCSVSTGSGSTCQPSFSR